MLLIESKEYNSQVMTEDEFGIRMERAIAASKEVGQTLNMLNRFTLKPTELAYTSMKLNAHETDFSSLRFESRDGTPQQQLVLRCENVLSTIWEKISEFFSWIWEKIKSIFGSGDSGSRSGGGGGKSSGSRTTVKKATDGLKKVGENKALEKAKNKAGKDFDIGTLSIEEQQNELKKIFGKLYTLFSHRFCDPINLSNAVKGFKAMALNRTIAVQTINEGVSKTSEENLQPLISNVQKAFKSKNFAKTPFGDKNCFAGEEGYGSFKIGDNLNLEFTLGNNNWSTTSKKWTQKQLEQIILEIFDALIFIEDEQKKFEAELEKLDKFGNNKKIPEGPGPESILKVVRLGSEFAVAGAKSFMAISGFVHSVTGDNSYD